MPSLFSKVEKFLVFLRDLCRPIKLKQTETRVFTTKRGDKLQFYGSTPWLGTFFSCYGVVSRSRSCGAASLLFSLVLLAGTSTKHARSGHVISERIFVEI